ncbi:MAG: MFS transporter [Deltaproteobacteria bacterium]|nr:MFS transporter [Deltaproteobacteria bacterium]MCB9789261.1 MFS transporter [Deltaproteobacteria bacterium]
MRRRSLLAVHFVVLIDMIGFGVLLPLLPYVALRYGASGVGVGGILSAYSVAQLLGAPLWGRLSDRFGRRPVLLATLLGSALSLAATGLSDSLFALLAARALAGLFAGSLSTAQAAIADVSAPEDRARSLGLLGATIGVGFILGPALGGLLAPLGFATTCFATAGLAATNLVLALFVLEETRRTDGPRVPRPFFARPRVSGSLGRLLLSTFLAMLAFVALETTFPLIAASRFGIAGRGMSAIFAGLGVVIVIVQGGLVGRLTRRLGSRRLARVGAVLMGLASIGVGFSGVLVLTLVLVGLLAAGQGLVRPSLAALVSLSEDASQQGTVLGLSQSMGAAARAIGPLAAGWLFDRSEAAPYVAAGVASLVVASLLAARADTPT